MLLKPPFVMLALVAFLAIHGLCVAEISNENNHRPAAAHGGIFTSFSEYLRAQGGDKRARISKVNAPGDAGAASTYQGSSYSDDEVTFAETSYPFSVAYCAANSDYFHSGTVTPGSNFAQLNLACPAEKYGYKPYRAGILPVCGNCFVWTDLTAIYKFLDEHGQPVYPATPVQLGVWKSNCNLYQEHGVEEKYGGYDGGNSQVELEGTVWYAERVYAQDLSCFENGSDGDGHNEDYGLIHRCLCGDGIRRSADSLRRLEYETARFGNRTEKLLRRQQRISTPGNNQARQGTKTPGTGTAELSYSSDKAPTYYALDYVYLYVGVITKYDKHGYKRSLGQVEMVLDLSYTMNDDGEPVPVAAPFLTNGLVVDCTHINFKWLDTQEKY